jgi:3-keto-5-aminohexanoate cleavage enzyme
MDDLIITVTCDASVTYPGFRGMPPLEDTDAVGQQYVDAVNAGATICHHHGVHYMDRQMADDGKKLMSIDHDGWQRLTDKIKTVGTDPIIQYGIASARLPEKVKLMEQGPDMMSWAFNPHDECFQPDPSIPANELYALHTRSELVDASRAARAAGVKLEIECFYTGAFWNLEYIRKMSLLDDPVWLTMFFGWPGATWTPPTAKAMTYMVDNLPANANWNVSIMDPARQWEMAALAIGLGGHVRVGWEDNPYLPDGELSTSNAQLVEVIVRMAETMGRPVADVATARRIVFGDDGGAAPAAPVEGDRA